MKEGRFRWLSAETEEERDRKVRDQDLCGYKLFTEWIWQGKIMLMFERKAES